MNIEIKKGEPLKLPDGTTLLPSPDGEGNKLLSAEEAEAKDELDARLDDPYFDGYQQHYKRTLAELPDTPKRMHTVMLVSAYSMWGLGDSELSILLDVSVEGIRKIRESETYMRVHQEMLEALRYSETATINGYLMEKARAAAIVVAGELKSKDGDRRLSAAKDVLDRSGFRPADRTEHVHKFEDELRIVHIQEENTPTVDVTPSYDNGE